MLNPNYGQMTPEERGRCIKAVCRFADIRLYELAAAVGVHPSTLYGRLRDGLTVQDALDLENTVHIIAGGMGWR